MYIFQLPLNQSNTSTPNQTQPPNSLLIDPFELPSPISPPQTTTTPTSATNPNRSTTPTTDTPANRKRSMVGNFGNVFNWDSILTKFMRDNNKLRDGSHKAVMAAQADNTLLSNNTDTQLIDIGNGETFTNVNSAQMQQQLPTETTATNEQTVVRSSNREIFQRAKQMRMLSRVGLNKKKRQNSLPSEGDNGEGRKEKDEKEKEGEFKPGSLVTANSIVLNDEPDLDDEDFDDTAFDQLRNRGID